uniref:parathyroid hormone 2 receptor-like isoform X1 n=1 Tax=Styela clava TaxID=7725 RepID=UPI0019392D0B|nr:parathyroid hormone 2 receptor-like isoform X1 [Styela clava]
MVDGGITSARDLLQILMNAMEVCESKLETAAKPLDVNGNALDIYCAGEWDNLICWPNSAPGPVKVKCPDYIVDFNHDEYVKRYCDTNGKWRKMASTNNTWHDYQGCFTDALISKQAIEDEIRAGATGPHMKSMIQLYTVGYSFSLVALTFAMIILAYFQRLHCTRNYIHMHLFASFMLRAIVIFVKDQVLFIGAGIFDIQTQTSETSLEELWDRVDSPGGHTYKVGCKIVMTLFHYFVATNYYWILVEALYLHSLIFVAFFSDKKYLWRFTLTGWGVPVLFVVPWAIVRGTLEDIHCWDISITEYKWIYNGPIVVANVINFLLFLNIIRVLWYKMRERGAINRSDNRRQYRKLAKSTLVLIPMFGVHAIVFIGMPDNIEKGLWWDIRMYFDLFFNSFQGFFVAIIYCFCNGEVQAEFKKAWERFNLSVEMQRGNRERSRSSVTMLTSFNSSVSQQARLSIAGQGNRRNSNVVKNCYQGTNNNNVSTSMTTALNRSNSIEYKTPLLEEVKDEHKTTNLSNGSVTVVRMQKEDFLLNLGDDEHLAPYASSTCVTNEIRSIPKIMEADEEDYEEKRFEMALEECPSKENSSSKPLDENVVSKYDSSSSSEISSDSNRASSCGTDSVTDNSCRRTPSFDSGISSMLGGNPRLSTVFPSDSSDKNNISVTSENET